VVAGTVTDPATSEPVAGAVVQVTGQGTQYTTRTDADGQYAIFGLVTGTYAKVAASEPGYLGDAHSGKAVSEADFDPATDTTDFSIRRDWAAASGGGSVVSIEGTDYGPFGCGPNESIDTSLNTSWVTDAGAVPGLTGTFDQKSIVIKLPRAVDVTSFGVDPGQTCGTGNSSSTGQLLIETSPDGTPGSWTPAAEPTFASDYSQNGQLNDVAASGGTTGVQYIRATIEHNQVPEPYGTNCPIGGFGGCEYSSLSEIAVFGAPAS
jgi:hypothetical protein